MTQLYPACSSFAGRSHFAMRVFLPLLLFWLITACSSFNPKIDKTAAWSVEQLYADAHAEIKEANWKAARERLISIESRYPFSIYAQQALLELAYVNWKDSENEQALSAIDRFQQLFPNHPGSDYALYLKGLIHFTPNSAFMSDYTGQDPAERDPKGLRASYAAFAELSKLYPQSIYAPDAKARMAWLVNTIAMNEVYVARYYYQRGAYIAAINRAQTVITDFDGVAANEEALHLMISSYDKLGLLDLKKDTQRVLDKNFPDSRFKTFNK